MLTEAASLHVAVSKHYRLTQRKSFAVQRMTLKAGYASVYHFLSLRNHSRHVQLVNAHQLPAS